MLLAPHSKIKFHIASDDSDKAIASKLGISKMLVKERRNLLETNYLQLLYIMRLADLGQRRIDFFIATQDGFTNAIAKTLLKLKNVVSVAQSIGAPTIDLRVELIVKDNGQLLELLEQVKSMKGVRDVVWSEIVRITGYKGSVPSDIIDIL